MTHALKQPATFQVYYQEAYNAIVRPHSFLWYFRRRWMRELGPVGTAIVLYVRGLCYHNPDKGELRDVCECRLEEIAEAIGVSRATVARELGSRRAVNAAGNQEAGTQQGEAQEDVPVNPALRRFVMRQAQYNLTQQGARRASSLYHVSMDDPIHPDDQAHYERLSEEYAARQQTRQGSLPPAYRRQFSDSARPESQNEIQEILPESQNEIHQECGAEPESHFAQPESQNETAYNTYSSLQNDSSALNVEAELHFVSRQESTLKTKKSDLRTAVLDKLTTAIVNELGDRGSEKRHRQLLDICERNGLDELAKKALLATRRRLAQEQDQGVLEKPGAYYQKILIGLLEDHQVFVPPAGSKDEQAEVRRLARESLKQDNL